MMDILGGFGIPNKDISNANILNDIVFTDENPDAVRIAARLGCEIADDLHMPQISHNHNGKNDPLFAMACKAGLNLCNILDIGITPFSLEMSESWKPILTLMCRRYGYKYTFEVISETTSLSLGVFQIWKEEAMSDKQPSPTLPCPTVTVIHNEKKIDSQTGIATPEKIQISIGREEGKYRTYTGEGNFTAEAVGKAVENIIADPHSAEWLPKPAEPPAKT